PEPDSGLPQSRSAAVSKTSRSVCKKPGRVNFFRASPFSGVLRLVFDTATLRIRWRHNACGSSGFRIWFLFALLLLPAFSSGSNLLYETTSPYHHIRVVD